jgi:hypothetical protein
LLGLAVWRSYAGNLSSTASAVDMLLDTRAAALLLALAVVAVPLTLIMEAIAFRVMGRVRDRLVSRWSAEYVPLWLVPSWSTRRSGGSMAHWFWPYGSGSPVRA